MSSSWRYYDTDLDRYAKQLDALQYEPLADNPLKRGAQTQGFFTVNGFSDGSLTPSRITSILASLQPPHGYGLLTPLPLPAFPSPPSRPSGFVPEPSRKGLSSFFSTPQPTPVGFTPAIIEKEQRLELRVAEKKREFQFRHDKVKRELEHVRSRCETNDYDAMRFMINLSHARHPLPAQLHLPIKIDFDSAVKVLLCTISIPDFASLAMTKQRSNSLKSLPVSASERRKLGETLLYALCLRAAYLASQCNLNNWFDTIAINAKQRWSDAATGQPKEGVVASFQAQTREIMALRIDQVDPKTCFRHFKGISTPSFEHVTPVRPIFVLNKDDDRIVQARDVTAELDEHANIAAMPWEDFEHLVRQLFEWEFGRSGIEVKLFRLSRDHGVDAVMYDPDPIRGGKYVLQAKRYTRPVDVAAVRDLYGTVVNEGANRGILVTTSSFGPDSYDFAKDKPISLVDGPNLLAMLQKHGQSYRINLEEARRLAKDVEGH